MATSRYSGFAWIFILFVLVVLALLVQLLPNGAGRTAWELIDLRTWTLKTCFWASALLFLCMFPLRFGGAIRAAIGRIFARESSVPRQLDERQSRMHSMTTKPTAQILSPSTSVVNSTIHEPPQDSEKSVND